MELEKMLSVAIRVAVDGHDGQFDKGGMPYILHPLAVAQMVGTADLELYIMALLHDVVEDNKKITFAYLESLGMTPRIITGLKLLTRVPGQTEEEYQAGILSSVDTMKVKSCDLRHNSSIDRLKGLREKDFERMRKYHTFFSKIRNQLADLSPSPLATGEEHF